MVTSINVLYAEDTDSYRTIFSKMMPKLAVKVHAYYVENGQFALEAALGKPFPSLVYRDGAWVEVMQEPVSFDIICTDQEMPIMKGLEFAKSYAKVKGTTPVILCSSNHYEIEEVRALGITHVLTKPFSRSAIERLFIQLHAN